MPRLPFCLRLGRPVARQGPDDLKNLPHRCADLQCPDRFLRRRELNVEGFVQGFIKRGFVGAHA